jgi:hypothetical protein
METGGTLHEFAQFPVNITAPISAGQADKVGRQITGPDTVNVSGPVVLYEKMCRRYGLELTSE